MYMYTVSLGCCEEKIFPGFNKNHIWCPRFLIPALLMGIWKSWLIMNIHWPRSLAKQGDSVIGIPKKGTNPPSTGLRLWWISTYITMDHNISQSDWERQCLAIIIRLMISLHPNPILVHSYTCHLRKACLQLSELIPYMSTSWILD